MQLLLQPPAHLHVFLTREPAPFQATGCGESSWTILFLYEMLPFEAPPTSGDSLEVYHQTKKWESQIIGSLLGNNHSLLDKKRTLFASQIPASFPEGKRLQQPFGDHEALSMEPKYSYLESAEKEPIT